MERDILKTAGTRVPTRRVYSRATTPRLSTRCELRKKERQSERERETKHLGRFQAVPYHLLCSMTVTQNAGRREGPTAQISGAELSANSDLSAARGSRWPVTVEEEAGACDRRRLRLAQGERGKKKITIKNK